VGNILGKCLAINSEGAAGRQGMLARGPDEQAAQLQELSLQDAQGAVRHERSHAVAADQFSQAITLMGLCRAVRPHLTERYRYSTIRQLPGRFTTSQAAADNGYSRGWCTSCHVVSGKQGEDDPSTLINILSKAWRHRYSARSLLFGQPGARQNACCLQLQAPAMETDRNWDVPLHPLSRLGRQGEQPDIHTDSCVRRCMTIGTGP